MLEWLPALLLKLWSGYGGPLNDPDTLDISDEFIVSFLDEWRNGDEWSVEKEAKQNRLVSKLSLSVATG